MTAQVEDRVLDFGLNDLDTLATHIYIVANATEPTSLAIATGATSSLGYKSFGAGGAFGTPQAGTGTSRKVSSTSVTDGTIVTTGTAGWWAATDNTNSRLLAHGTLASSQSVTAGNSFTLSIFDITIPNHA